MLPEAHPPCLLAKAPRLEMFAAPRRVHHRGMPRSLRRRCRQWRCPGESADGSNFHPAMTWQILTILESSDSTHSRATWKSSPRRIVRDPAAMIEDEADGDQRDAAADDLDGE